MSVAKKREPGPEGTWAQRFLASCSAVGQKACTEVGRHPFRTVYISAVAQRGRNSQLYPFQGHFSGIFSINEREGPTGLLKGAGKKTPFWSHFLYTKNNDFTKTRSGQTLGKLQKRNTVSAGPRVAAEGLRVLLGAPGINATAIELDAR